MRSEGGGPPVGMVRVAALVEVAPSRTAPAAVAAAPNAARRLHAGEPVRHRPEVNPREAKKPLFSAAIIPAHPEVDPEVDIGTGGTSEKGSLVHDRLWRHFDQERAICGSGSTLK
ncbi:hypothetical protein [Streptomyces sp. NPDC003006]